MAKRKKNTDQVVIESEFDAPIENKQDENVNTIAEDWKAPESESKPHNHRCHRHIRRL